MKIQLLESLEGQVALVSGANRGLGAAIANGLVAKGVKVYAGTRRSRAPRATRAQVPIRLDVTDEATVAAAVEAIEASEGRLDIVVNNAGVGSHWGQDLVAVPTEDVDTVLQTNLRGAILLAKHALPLVLRRRGGRIINMSSGLGAFTEGMGAGAPAYRISKAALNGFTAYLHGEYRRRGLVANSVCPGWVRTDMGGPQASRSVERGAETPLWLATFAPSAPGGLFWRDKKIIPW